MCLRNRLPTIVLLVEGRNESAVNLRSTPMGYGIIERMCDAFVPNWPDHVELTNTLPY
jgi:hypothetical protein